MPQASVVDPALRPATAHTRIGPYLRQVWDRREYIVYVAVSQLRAQRMTTVLGNLWHLLNPALQITVSYIIFGVLLGTDRGVDNFIAFLAVGIFAYQFSTRSTMQGTRSIAGNMSLIKSFMFPRVVLPLTSTTASFLAFLPTVIVMFGVVLVTGESPRWSWLVLPVVVALQIPFNLGAAMIAARAAFIIPDLQQLLPFVFRLVFYSSGVLFLVDAYVENPTYRWFFIFNPFYGFVSLYRWVVLGTSLETAVVPVLCAWSAVALVGGFLWFKAGERSYASG